MQERRGRLTISTKRPNLASFGLTKEILCRLPDLDVPTPKRSLRIDLSCFRRRRWRETDGGDDRETTQ